MVSEAEAGIEAAEFFEGNGASGRAEDSAGQFADFNGIEERPQLGLDPAIAGVIGGDEECAAGFELGLEGLEEFLGGFGGVTGEGGEED